MKVNQLTPCDEGITNPKRSTFGITFALRWGDVLHPLGSEGNWFKEPYFTKVLRLSMPMAVPVLSCCLWMICIVVLAVRVEWWAMLALPTFLLIPGAFVTWNLFGLRGYTGWKVFGVDAPEYKLWPAMKGMEHEVYAGSQAIQFSARLRISD